MFLRPAGGRADRTSVIEQRMRFSAARQGRVLLPLLGVWAVGMAVLAVAVLSGPVEKFVLDPTYALGGAWYIGAVSQLGVLGWAVSVTTAMFCAWWCRMAGRPRVAGFLACGGGVSALLLFDDLFGFHSVVGSIGLGKPVALALTVCPVFAWLVGFRDEIVRTRWIILSASLLASLISVLVDTTIAPSGRLGLLVEDGSKFLGILAWATWFVTTAADISRSVYREALTAAPPSAARMGNGVSV